MTDFELVFCDPNTKENEYAIPFALANNSTAIKWLTLLYKDVYVRNCGWTNNRFVGFGDLTTNENAIRHEMNAMIDICEKERPGFFNIKISDTISQEDFNKIHTWFEVYRGKLENPHEFFQAGSNEFQHAIERFNQLIHMWEASKIGNPIAEFDVDMSSTIPFEDGDYKNFEFNRYTNAIRLPFVSRGKTLLDLYYDDDNHIDNSNVISYKYISSSFLLYCTPGWDEKKQRERYSAFMNWFDQKSNYLNSLGFHKDDPKSCIGWIPLAHSLIPDIKSIIEPRQHLKSIRIFEA